MTKVILLFRLDEGIARDTCYYKTKPAAGAVGVSVEELRCRRNRVIFDIKLDITEVLCWFFGRAKTVRVS